MNSAATGRRLVFGPTALAGVFTVEPILLRDERGFFARTSCEREFADAGLTGRFVQSSVSFNEAPGTLRGLHYQRAPHAEEKLVRCTAGRIFDVVVDLRPDSASYLQWCGFELSADNHVAVYIPAGCAHGFMTLTAGSEVLYQISCYHAPGFAAGVRWDDPRFGINWPAGPASISERDAGYPDFQD